LLIQMRDLALCLTNGVNWARRGAVAHNGNSLDAAGCFDSVRHGWRAPTPVRSNGRNPSAWGSFAQFSSRRAANHPWNFAASQRSASSAAIQPVPAAVTACR
jgi:hypothetical protein